MSIFTSKTHDASATTSPIPDEFIDSDCIAHIRPQAGYNEDAGFGFDWMRIADTKLNGDYAYKDIVGKLYKPDLSDVVMDVNDADDIRNKFRTNDKMYEELENEYNLASGSKAIIKSKNAKTGKTELNRYYVPILALGRSKSERTGKSNKSQNPKHIPTFKADERTVVTHVAKLELRLDIKASPKQIFWEFPKGYSGATELSESRPADIIIRSKQIPIAAKQHTIDIEVMCFAILTRPVDVKLMAKSANGRTKMIGAFRIWKNLTKKSKIALIQVISNIKGGDKSFELTDLYKERERIQKYFRQALLSPDIDIIEDFKMNEKNGWIFSGRNLDKYKTSGGKLLARNDYKKDQNVYNYLRESFEEEYKGYKDVIKIFYVNEEAVNLINDGSRSGKITPFYAANQNGTNTILFTSKGIGQVWSSAHEALHALELMHSFTNVEVAPNAVKYTYKPCVTDNIMDYTGSKGNLFNLWYWQWKFLNK